MNAITARYPSRAAIRMEIFHNLTVTLRTGYAMSVAMRLSKLPLKPFARRVGLPPQMARQILDLHALFVGRFGPEVLSVNEDESVTIDPAILTDFLSQPAAIKIVSDISSMSEANILYIIQQT